MTSAVVQDEVMVDGDFVPQDYVAGVEFVPLSDDDFSDTDDDSLATSITSPLPLPDSLAYHPRYTELQQTISTAVRETIDLLTISAKCRRLERFKDEGRQLVQVPKPRPIRIALVGDVGHGKSSLLDCLIDVPNLAHAVSSGSSCTSVACEYTDKLPNQSAKFAADITYYNTEETRDVLLAHLRAYNLFHYEREPDWDDELRIRYQNSATSALDAFLSLFKDRPEFATKQAGEAYLADNCDEPATVLDTMQDWFQLHNERASEDDSEACRVMSDGLRTFQRALYPKIGPSSSIEGPSLWPLVKEVRIGIQGSKFLEHITLADLPGLSDTNQIKVNATHEYLRGCDGLWIVGTIDRINSHTTVGRLLAMFGERFKHNVAVIATKIDAGVDSSLRRYLRDHHPTYLEPYKQSQGRKKALLKLKKDTNERMADLRRQKAMTQPLRPQFIQALANIAKEVRALDQNALKELVLARNRLNRDIMQEKMREYLPEENVSAPIFFVSNAHYQRATRGQAIVGSGEFQLDLENTGIPGLQQHVYKLAAEGIIKSFDDYLYHRVQVFVRSMWIWASGGVAQGNIGVSLLEEIVKTPRLCLPSRMTEYVTKMQIQVIDRYVTVLKASAEEHSRLAVEKLIDKRQSAHHATFRAFVRHNGNHSTSACPQQSWNEQFQAASSKLIVGLWPSLTARQAELLNSEINKIANDIDALPSLIKARNVHMERDLDDFRAVIDGSEFGLEGAFSEHQERIERELGNIKLDATRDRHTSFFTRSMDPAYENCEYESGQGSVQRCLEHLRDHLTLGVDGILPFEAAAEFFKEALQGAFGKELSILSTTLEDILDRICESFSTITDDHNLDPQVSHRRTLLKTHLLKIMKVLDDVKMEVGQIKADCTSRSTPPEQANAQMNVASVSESQAAQTEQETLEEKEIKREPEALTM